MVEGVDIDWEYPKGKLSSRGNGVGSSRGNVDNA